MPFWKKGEDPWDLDPAKRRELIARETEEQGRNRGLLDQLQDWNEERKAEKARKLAESVPDPIPCPWCGNIMEARFLWGGSVYLAKERPGLFSGGLFDEKWIFLDEGDLISGSYKTVWYCKDCRKLAADLPPEPSSLAAEAAPEQTQEEQREGEQ